MMKKKLCAHCKGRLTEDERGIHPSCIDAFAEAQQAKAERKAEKKAQELAKLDKAETRAKLKSMRKITEFIADAQKAFNAFIRERDKDLPCVSCGEVNPPYFGVGGQWDAGHFLSRGAHKAKRYWEDNCHKQCKSCNSGAKKNPAKEATVTERYRAELIKRIGQERYEALIAPVPEPKWTREQLLEIESTYKAKLKALKASR